MRPIAAAILLQLVAAVALGQTFEAEVDFADYRGPQRSMLGMNHGAIPRLDVPARTQPAFLEFIDPLDFRMWSTGGNMGRTGFVEMVHRTHPQARAFLRLGAGRLKRCPYTGSPNRPYTTPVAYREYVRCAAAWARDNGVDVLDVWNEPNMQSFHGDPAMLRDKRELFFEIFKMAHETIREVWPDATIAGPSLGKTDQESWLRDFMEFCEEERLEVPVLTWHEIGTLTTAARLAALPAKLRRARRDYVNGPNYPHVGVREIVINEFTAKRFHNIPASNLAALFYLEQGGANAAARTCSPEFESSECFANTLNGLVTLPDENGEQEKRAMWWVMRHYRKSLPNRVGFSREIENVVGLANYDQVLLGLYENPEFTEETGRSKLTLRLKLEHLEELPWLDPEAGSISLRLRRIPFDGPEKARPTIRVINRREVPIETAADGSRRAVFSLQMEVHSVVVVEFVRDGEAAQNSRRAGAATSPGGGAPGDVTARRPPRPAPRDPAPAVAKPVPANDRPTERPGWWTKKATADEGGR